MISQENRPISSPPLHYHGDIVRKLFFIAGILMLGTLAYFAPLINLSLIISVVAIIFLAFLSGLESPNHKRVVIINTIASAIGCGFFQYTAVNFYLSSTTNMTIDWAFFAVNQILALIFFVALYFSSKTVRAWKQIQLK